MNIDRRFVSQGEGEVTYELPMDIKAEAAVGLALCILGAVMSFTSQMKNIDIL